MTEIEQLILDKLNTMEEAIKLLLVNDVLKDTEELAGQGLKHPVQHTNVDSQKSSAQQAKKINDLEKHIEIQSNRIHTLQALVDSKEKTLQSKEERIKLLQNTVEELQNKISILSTEINELRSQHESNDSLKCIEKAKEMGAYRIGAAFRLPSGYCQQANGRVWRIISLHGDVVTLRRSHATHRYEENFYIRNILQYYEHV